MGELESKKPYFSKTIIIGAISGLIGSIALFWPQANVVTAWINANGATITLGWGVLAGVLRLVTKNKISLTD